MQTGFEAMFAMLASSRSYRAAVTSAHLDLPEWVLPYSGLDAALVARTVEALAPPTPATLVDLGCGFGAAGLSVAHRTAASLIGVDFLPTALAVAGRAAHEGGVSARFVCGSAEATTLEDAIADGVVCFDVLMFMDARVALVELTRIARPGARVVVTASEWIAESEPPLPTAVRAYAPLIEVVGFVILEAKELGRSHTDALYRAVVAHANELLTEHGDAAQLLIDEARPYADPDRVQRTSSRWFLARQPAKKASPANPFLDVSIDATAKYQPFATSTLTGLRPWRETELQLLEEAVRVSKRSAAHLAHAGLLREAAAEVQNDYRRQHADTTASGNDIEGIRDHDLTAVISKHQEAGKAIFASTLRGAHKTSRSTTSESNFAS